MYPTILPENINIQEMREELLVNYSKSALVDLVIELRIKNSNLAKVYQELKKEVRK